MVNLGRGREKTHAKFSVSATGVKNFEFENKFELVTNPNEKPN